MSTHETPAPRRELGPLDILAGAWSIDALFPNMPTGHGRAIFEWASGGAFLLQRVELLVDRAVVPHDAAPDSIAIIGPAVYRREIDGMLPTAGQIGSTRYGGEDV